ncbi:MAG: STAS/SEC14 domain-containing protein [Acidobacteriota bacterium]
MSLPMGNEDGTRVVRERIGRQLTAFEEPDIIYMKFVGDVTDDEVRAINDLHLEICKGRDRVYFLVDMEELATLSSSVRRSAIEALNQMPIQGLSIYKAPMTARVLAKLIITGMRLFGKHIPLQFSDTEAEAREWIAERRELTA